MPHSAAGWLFWAIGIVLLIGALIWAIFSLIDGSIFSSYKLAYIIILAIIGAIFIYVQQSKFP